MPSSKSEELRPFEEHVRWAERRGAFLVLSVFSVFLCASLLFLSFFSTAITSAVAALAIEGARGAQEVVASLFEKYAPELEKLLLALQENLENLEEELAGAGPLPEIEAIHYYLINPQGVIYRTNYPEDLGLNLSAFPRFWKALQEELAQKAVVVHPFALETRTGRIRMYLYTRTNRGDILELGVTLRKDFLRPFFDSLSKLRKLPFVEDIGLYSAHFLPIAPNFSPLPERLKERIRSSSKRSFGFMPRVTVQRMAVPLLGKATTTLFAITTFNFLPLYAFSGVLLSGGLLFLLYLQKQHRRCFAQITHDLRILNTMAQDDPRARGDSSPIFLETARAIKALLASQKEIEEAFTVFAHKLALVAEGYDTKTSQHMQRVAKVAELIAKELGITNPDIPRYAGLHDIGKIFIPREILRKKGPLTEEEWGIMKSHPLFAEQLLDHPRLITARNMALYHHENFDGTGYPKGLRGEEIPIEAQILKIADTYDTLRDERPYRRAFSHEEAMRIILEGDGRVRPEHFHPKVLAAFVKLEKDICRLYGEV